MTDHWAKLRTPILSESVKDLRCKPDAPYPTEVKATLHEQELFREYVRQFRRAHEHVPLKEVK